MPRLMIFDDRIRAVDLPDRVVVIGRSRKTDIPIEDEILSRQHCEISPTARSYELRDLGSAHGTFVNGARVEQVELEFDDIVEIGHTVLVLLDTETWNRGEGLTRLRNPVKAQALIQRINRSVPPEPDEAAARFVAELSGSGAPASAKTSEPPAERGSRRSRSRSGRGREATREECDAAAVLRAAIDAGPDVGAETIFERLVLHEYGKRLLAASPELRKLVRRTVDDLFDDPELAARVDALRRAIRDALARRASS